MQAGPLFLGYPETCLAWSLAPPLARLVSGNLQGMSFIVIFSVTAPCTIMQVVWCTALVSGVHIWDYTNYSLWSSTAYKPYNSKQTQIWSIHPSIDLPTHPCPHHHFSSTLVINGGIHIYIIIHLRKPKCGEIIWHWKYLSTNERPSVWAQLADFPWGLISGLDKAYKTDNRTAQGF